MLPSWRCARKDNPASPEFPPARKPAPRRESLRRCRDRPRYLPMKQASAVAASPRCAGSIDVEARMDRRGRSSPAIPATVRHSDPIALPFHVKRASGRELQLCQGRDLAIAFGWGLWAFARWVAADGPGCHWVSVLIVHANDKFHGTIYTDRSGLLHRLAPL